MKRPFYFYLCVKCRKKETLARKKTFFPERELHVPGYNYLKPGTKLERRPERDKTVDRLDAAVREHDIVYTHAASSLEEKHKADPAMIENIF